MVKKKTSVLRMSKLYVPTLKEDPSDADVPSAKLLTRAGFVRKQAAGQYTFLPLGQRVLNKVEAIIREEMDAADAQEVLMPFVQPAELWHDSGRWDVYGPELLRVVDRHDNEFCLSPTAEELVTDLVHNELRSYKELPVNLYQIQTKFRDEIRPRFGLLRGREFIMKDAYSFDASEESLAESYDKMRQAYCNIYDRIGLDYRIVEADPGQIGGDGGTEEFMVLAEKGEAELVFCECGYSSDTEVGACRPQASAYEADTMHKISTPGVHTIAELCEFLGCPESSTAKAFSGKDDEGTVWVLFVPGNYEVNECKVSNLLGGFTALTDEEMRDAGLVKGSMGPVGLPAGVKVAADECLRSVERWVVGANEDGFHYTGAAQGTDFTVDMWGDMCVVQPGDACPTCGKPLQSARGIEVGQVFKLGDKYSRSMDVKFMDKDGKEQYFLMGCYGIGVTRTVAAIVEQCHDDDGMFWPMPVAPAHVCILPLAVGDDTVQPAAEKLAQQLCDLGLEVVIDDRKERPGVKFAEADLIGWPVQVVVGKRGLENKTFEVKVRSTQAKRDVSFAVMNEIIATAHRTEKSARSFMQQAGADLATQRRAIADALRKDGSADNTEQ